VLALWAVENLLRGHLPIDKSTPVTQLGCQLFGYNCDCSSHILCNTIHTCFVIRFFNSFAPRSPCSACGGGPPRFWSMVFVSDAKHTHIGRGHAKRSASRHGWCYLTYITRYVKTLYISCDTQCLAEHSFSCTQSHMNTQYIESSQFRVSGGGLAGGLTANLPCMHTLWRPRHLKKTTEKRQRTSGRANGTLTADNQTHLPFSRDA
jgi:hypothetical protein